MTSVHANQPVNIRIFDEKSHLILLDSMVGYIIRKKCPAIIILNHKSDLGIYSEQYILNLDSSIHDYISIINSDHLKEIKSIFDKKIENLPRLMVFEKESNLYELIEYDTE